MTLTMPGSTVRHLQIWYRHSNRGKNSLTAHPTGRPHQPSAVSVQVTKSARRPSFAMSTVSVSILSRSVHFASDSPFT